MGLREAAALDPRDHVADLESSIFDAHGHAVLSAGARGGKQVATRLQHAQALSPDLSARHVVVPALSHELQPVGRIRHD